MSSSEKKIEPTIERNEKLASIKSLLEKELELEESLLNDELTEDGVKNTNESEQTIGGTEKSVANLSSPKPQELGDSDTLDDDFKLKWVEEDVDPKKQVILLDESLLSIADESSDDAVKIDLTSQEDVIKAIQDEEKLLDDLDIENKLVQSPKFSSTCSQPVFKSGHGVNKPDIMLEIPTQELIECSDDENSSIHNLEMSNLNNDSLDDEKLLASDEEISLKSPALDIETDSTNLPIEEKNVMERNSSKTISLIDEAKLAADILERELSSMDIETVTELDEELLLQDDSNECEVFTGMKITSELGNEVLQIDKQQEEDSIDIELREQMENVTDNINIEGAMDDSEDTFSLSKNLNVANSYKVVDTRALTETEEQTDVEMIEPVIVSEVLQSISSEKSSIEPISKNINSEQKILLKSDQNIDILKDTKKDSTETKSNETDEPVSKDVLDYILDVNAKKNLEIESTESQSVESDQPSIKVIDLEPTVMETSDHPPVMEKENTQELDSQPSTSFDISNQDPEASTCDQKNENMLFGSSAENIDVPEMADSLGLLAESCHIIEDDEEQDDDDEAEDYDESDHYQDDESSNQVTAEHSEDSNAQHSETEAPKSDKEDALDDITLDTDQKYELNLNEKSENQESTDKEKAEDLENPKQRLLKSLLIQNEDLQETEEQSPPKIRKLGSTKVVNFVDLESSEEDVQEDSAKVIEGKSADEDGEFKSTVQHAPSSVEELSSDDAATTKRTKTPVGLEVFNLDSDDEEPVGKIVKVRNNDIKNEQDHEKEKQLDLETIKCLNRLCTKKSEEFYIANMQTIKFYEVDRKKRCYVCRDCNDAVENRNMELITGIRDFKPLIEMKSQKSKDELVEISDSESEEEEETDNPDDQLIGPDAAKIEEQLVNVFNETWDKYKMEVRLEDTQDSFLKQIEKLQKESKELNDLLNECQAATDKTRRELYETFEPKIVELTPLDIYDTPTCSYSSTAATPNIKREIKPTLKVKRSLSPTVEVPAKRPAIPLGYTPLDSKHFQETTIKMEDDLQEVSVVKLSAESPPPDLPPPGDLDLTLLPLRIGMPIYAKRNLSGAWLPAKIVELTPKTAANPFTLCRVKYDQKAVTQLVRTLQARYVAYAEPAEVRMTIGRRVIALFRDEGKKIIYHSGIIAEIPNPVNDYRYLVFFDDGYCQYVPHSETRLVCECSPLVWEEVDLSCRDFVKNYLQSYPERPMVRLRPGQSLKVEWKGKWWPTRVLGVDASLVEVFFLKLHRQEFIYRGSNRLSPLFLELKAAERHRTRAMPRTQVQARTNVPYVEYTRSDEQNKSLDAQKQLFIQQQEEEIRRQRAVAKKSTSTVQPPPKPLNSNLDNVCSRVVYYTPKNAVKPYRMVPHVCSPRCKRTDVLALKDLRTYNPLAKPLLSGWERQIVRWKGHREVMYKAPCGRRFRDMKELHKYLRDVESDMAVDLFDFSPNTHCLAEFVLNNCYVGKKDLSHGKENVPVPCVNYYDDSLPEFCSYNTERTPTAGVPLNLDSDFLCGCDCEDDCEDKTKCACWKMTLEGARTIGLEGENVGYVYKRLPDPLPSGIYECNSRCKCKHTCLNRVAQHPLQLKLQVFKTANRGWGIRALNDIPKGAFLCVYAGNLLTDATANLDGLNEGDEYLAELDYIEVVEQMKEGYEEDIPEKMKKSIKKEKSQQSEESEDESSDEESNHSRNEQEDDDDFQPGYISENVIEFNKRLRRREFKKEKEDEKDKDSKKENKADKDKDSQKENEADKDKGSQKENEADKDKDSQKENEADKDKGSQKENETDKDKGSQKENEADKDKDSQKENEAEKDKSSQKENEAEKDKDSENENEAEKDKDSQKENEADKDEDCQKDNQAEKDKDCEKEKQAEKDKDCEKENEAEKEKDSQKDKDGEKKKDDKNPDSDFITISDDEEVREPSCFTAAAGMGGNQFVSKYKSVRTLFGQDEACYIMDAKVQGNIGRYLNHSCSPNVFVQNVFVDTHDPRFPWVAFFALSYIKSGTELTWNYNYDIGSVPGKVMYCLCGSANCRGRLL